MTAQPSLTVPVAERMANEAEVRRRLAERFDASLTRVHIKACVPDPEWLPDNSLDRKIAAAREEMGEARWAELQKEWA